MNTPITEAHKALWTTLYNLAHDEIFDVASSDGPAHQLIADSEARAVAALTAERDQLHDQLHALRLICGTTDADKFSTWVDRANARAERAEADLAAAKERLRSEAMDDYASIKDLQRELAAERARLNSGQILVIVAGERVWHCGVDLRAAIDAGMKEGAK